MRTWPAIDIRSIPTDNVANAGTLENLELLYATLDDFAPTAIEEREDAVRAFFASTPARDAALRAMSTRHHVRPVEVSDEDWARRSQANLKPVRVGRLLILPSAAEWPLPGDDCLSAGAGSGSGAGSGAGAASAAATIVIAPSMGFGTGHHATTRLCLAALQTCDLTGKTVVDFGTGSGVLAIAAGRLGAAQVIGLDVDPDAVQSARENLGRNPGIAGVEFAEGDLRTQRSLPTADVVTANLTGALLVQCARTIVAATKPGGVIILSGLMAGEVHDVLRAFAGATVISERQEDEWVGLAMKKS